VLGGVGDLAVCGGFRAALGGKLVGNEVFARVGGLFAGHQDLVAPAAGGGACEVLASGVRRIHNLLVRGVFHGAARPSVNYFQIEAV
jgi:hypothetical protein